jgi:hypothetical protein
MIDENQTAAQAEPNAQEQAPQIEKPAQPEPQPESQAEPAPAQSEPLAAQTEPQQSEPAPTQPEPIQQEPEPKEAAPIQEQAAQNEPTPDQEDRVSLAAAMLSQPEPSAPTSPPPAASQPQQSPTPAAAHETALQPQASTQTAPDMSTPAEPAEPPQPRITGHSLRQPRAQRVQQPQKTWERTPQPVRQNSPYEPARQNSQYEPVATVTQSAAPVPSSSQSQRFSERVEQPRAAISPQRSASAEVQPKYATYSMSEIDQMLKQQAEAIGNSLGAKISSQQRTFQEAVTAQEKAFTKNADGFIARLEMVLQKVEGASKASQESVSRDMEEFKRVLAKELEQHRSQINKTVLPVAKALEDKPVRPQKERPEKQSTVQVKSDPALKTLLMATLIAAIASTILAFIAWTQATDATARLAKLESVQDKLDKIGQRVDMLFEGGTHPTK